jgi:hypothetical protein
MTEEKFHKITFRVSEETIQKALEINKNSNKLAKEIFENYIQERTVPTPTPEELVAWIQKMRQRIISYMMASFIPHYTLCDWICEEHKISKKQFYDVLPKIFTGSANENKDGSHKLSYSTGMNNSQSFEIPGVGRMKFIHVLEVED